MVYKGSVTILARDLRMFVNKATCQNLSVIAIASMVAALGAKSVRVREQTCKEQHRWALPTEEFDPKDLPDRDGGVRADAV
jgi:hypothetical protein